MVVLCAARPGFPLLVLGAAFMAASAYIWGYATRALKRASPHWPSLHHLRRSDYREVWDTLALPRVRAFEATTGQVKEDFIRALGQAFVEGLVELVGLNKDDEVLEIGPGIGRVGLILAPRCRSWTGADISSNMLAHAAKRLDGLPNVRLVQLSNVGLAEFSDASFDMVYSTWVFAHLDEVDRWRYVEEAFRVLRSRGRIYIDNTDMEGDEGWAMFLTEYRPPEQRPPYTPTPSTASELITYLRRAGFEKICSHRRPPMVVATGVKPG